MAESISARRILIIGIGNTLRRDDGAGWLFADRMTTELRSEECQVQLELQQQLTPDLALIAAEFQPTDIIFVDASVSVTTPALTPLSPQQDTDESPHALSPGMVLAMAARLYDVTASGWLVQTPALDLGHGEGLSEPALRSVEAAPTLSRQLLIARR